MTDNNCAAILSDTALGTNSRLAEQLSRVLDEAGIKASLIDYRQFANLAPDSLAELALLAIPDAGRFPAVAKPNLLRFLGVGGKLFIIGG
ncbi:MAG: hypothetical protein QGD94_08235, partial [Planctomycetia bacterium]|nr:hypothetical protein [Planctomycetia bacterium]